VLALKFSNKLINSRLFAELLLPQQLHIDDSYILMPVPLHISRLRKRGYNQAYEIAKELAKLSGRELHSSLTRQKKTAMQAELNLKQRAQNVNNAFVLKSERVAQHIILVDDVMTTGFTLNECAKTLIKAGAKDVKVLIFARKLLS
jgi:ComF family protein